MMHQVLYIVQLPNEEGDMHKHLMRHDMPCDPNLVSSAFYTIPIYVLLLHGQPSVKKNRSIRGGVKQPCFYIDQWFDSPPKIHAEHI